MAEPAGLKPLSEVVIELEAVYDPAGVTPCLLCGRPADVGYTVACGAPLCSRECVQRSLDERGATVHFPDGSVRRARPGQIRLTEPNPNQG